MILGDDRAAERLDERVECRVVLRAAAEIEARPTVRAVAVRRGDGRRQQRVGGRRGKRPGRANQLQREAAGQTTQPRSRQARGERPALVVRSDAGGNRAGGYG